MRCKFESDYKGMYGTPLIGWSRERGIWAVWVGWLFWLWTFPIGRRSREEMIRTRGVFE
jgi:hypothetical protein